MAEPMEKPFGHEPDAVHYRTILLCVGVLAAVVIGVAVGLHFILTRAVIPNHAEIAAQPARIPPTPRLQAHPQTDFAKFRAKKDALLSQYAWPDPQRDYARVPIQRAMQIYVQQHAHANATPASASSSAESPMPSGTQQ
ncbi:MAG TPA: hypothetical protein VFI32_06280 [Rhodanobacteraceae bacterium]|nr:hypothetical protein [Rhodanobacteraceae bacterium]